MGGDISHREEEKKKQAEDEMEKMVEKNNGSGYTNDEFRRHRFELDERAFRNEDSEDSTPGSGNSSSTEENDEVEPSQEIVLGVPAYSPKLLPRQVLGYPIHSLVSVRRNESSMGIRILCRVLELNPRATFFMFTLAFILPWLCFAVAFYALLYARRRGFYPF